MLVMVATGLLMFGALGLALDSGTLYFHRQMAQAAADAVAVSSIMSVFQGKNATGDAGHFDTSSGAAGFDCSGNVTMIPCKYASTHGFGPGAADTIHVSFPATPAGWEGLLSTDPTNQVKITISRQVRNSFIRMLGGSATTKITATATAGIVTVTSPVPLLILHPHKADALAMNGNTKIEICGGPTQSIQINSDSASAYGGGGSISLVNAGPGTAVSADCPTPHGSGADFGVFGHITTPGNISFGTLPGKFIQPSSPIQDPLLSVNPPARPATVNPATVPGTAADGCLPSDSKGCDVYSPGAYTGGINAKNKTLLFKPGIYYMDSKGFSTDANGKMRMCTIGSANCGPKSADPSIDDGMLVYNKYTSGSAPEFSVGSNGDVILKGTPQAIFDISGNVIGSTTYKGILFFQDRTAPAATHILGGNGCLQLEGTIYATNTAAFIETHPTWYQTIEYHGNPCSTTYTKGQIVTDSVTMKGTADLRMLLESKGILKVRQVALVN